MVSVCISFMPLFSFMDDPPVIFVIALCQQQTIPKALVNSYTTIHQSYLRNTGHVDRHKDGYMVCCQVWVCSSSWSSAL